MTDEHAYDELVRRSTEATLLHSCASLLEWEEQTYMPAGGLAHRGNQLALLAGLTHEKRTDPAIGELLCRLERSPLVADARSAPAVNVRELRRSFDRATRLPKSLVEELARTTTLAQRHWSESRRTNNFAGFLPWLDKVMRLKRAEADALGYVDARYDALLDTYEPGARTARIATLFAGLRDELVPLVSAIAAAPRRPNKELVERPFAVDRQRMFAESAAAAIGFDFQAGRLDTTTHPFCSGIGPGDCRITTRYKTNRFNDAFFGTLHEAGHGLYEQGLYREHYGTPMGETVSLGVHESQSRLWENAVGRRRSFWLHFFPRARQLFTASLADTSADEFHFAVNTVEPSFIRVEADEVTYNLHILIRFELEQALLNGDLAPSDVPGAWNEKYAGYLGITPPDDAMGCLQDIHWSAGLIGYFPTYTLGNIYGAQFFAQAQEELGDLDASFAAGEFAPLLDWLREKIHRHGMRYRPGELVEHVTGTPPDPAPLVASLRAKFEPLYGLR